jgi:DNA-directed RNA polymerase
MTTVYGVTYVGARDQIEKQLRDKVNIPQEARWKISAYVARQVSDTVSLCIFLSADALVRPSMLSATCSMGPRRSRIGST